MTGVGGEDVFFYVEFPVIDQKARGNQQRSFFNKSRGSSTNWRTPSRAIRLMTASDGLSGLFWLVWFNQLIWSVSFIWLFWFV